MRSLHQLNELNECMSFCFTGERKIDICNGFCILGGHEVRYFGEGERGGRLMPASLRFGFLIFLSF